MRRVGAPRIYTSPTHFLRNHYVEMDKSGVVNVHPLTHELPMTEWLQGLLILSPLASISKRSTYKIEDFFTDTTNAEEAEHLPSLHVWLLKDVTTSETPQRIIP